MAPDILSTRDGGIATVTLFNPDKLNALNAAMWRRLAEVFATLDADETLRCVIVRGEGAAFAAGGDLDEMQQLRATLEGELAGLLRLAGPAVVTEILLEGRLLTAREAYEKGLLTRVVPDAEVAAVSHATAERIAAGAPLVARWHKQWIARLQQPRPLSVEELRASFAFLDSADYAEGLAAFRAKRPPRFTGQ